MSHDMPSPQLITPQMARRMLAASGIEIPVQDDQPPAVEESGACPSPTEEDSQ